MKIQWQIKKKRGNFRPCLNYTITLEDFERRLAIHSVWVQSRIPEIPNPHLSFCMPGENERHPDWTPMAFHRIQVPYFKTGEARAFIRLPFRDSDAYPEVAASFKTLRAAYEVQVCKAYGQAPYEQAGTLGVTSKTREQVAARVTADRLLNLFSPSERLDGPAAPDIRGAFSQKMAG